MLLTVLGTGGAYPGEGGACSGYLIAEADTRLLVDCGTGTLGNLQRHAQPWEVSHIIITHLHADHFLDIFPFRYALWRTGRGCPVMHLPPGGEEALLRISGLFDPSPTFFSDFFDIEEYDPNGTIGLGDLTVQLAPVKHYIPTCAVAVSGEGRLVYSADCGPCEALEDLADGADLFLCEAGRLEGEEGSWGHMSVREAAGIASRAGVGRLVLTHFWPGHDYGRELALARDVFSGRIEMAVVHGAYAV